MAHRLPAVAAAIRIANGIARAMAIPDLVEGCNPWVTRLVKAVLDVTVAVAVDPSLGELWLAAPARPDALAARCRAEERRGRGRA